MFSKHPIGIREELIEEKGMARQNSQLSSERPGKETAES
jgi:hypothetical protein